jgi:drug/metabolite transporter (DMT)-like permease
MDPLIAALVLFAAFMHAAWNGLLRGGEDRLWTMTAISIAMAAACLAGLPFLPLPASASWPYIVASGLIHMGYNLSLVRQYRTGDLGEAYPIARGASPLLVTIGAGLFAGEHLNVVAWLGIALISAGIIAMAFRGRHLKTETLPAALTTGFFIAVYSVVDGMGARLSGSAAAYTAWMGVFYFLMPLYFWMTRGAAAFAAPGKAWIYALTGGVLSLTAYGIVIFAMQKSPMGIVSALRETSVIFATLIGWFFLGEILTWRRIAACLVICLGAASLGFSRHSNGGVHALRDACENWPAGLPKIAQTSGFRGGAHFSRERF